MSSINLDYINIPTRTHNRLLKHLGAGNYEMCIDNTTLEKLTTCPRAYEFYAVYGRDQGERDALNYGSAIHKACEIYFTGGTLDNMIQSLVDHFKHFPCAVESWRNLDHAINAVKQYHALREQLPPWTPIEYLGKPMVEVPFKIPLFTKKFGELAVDYPMRLVTDNTQNEHQLGFSYKSISVFWTGKIDLVTMRNGAPWPIDHKTTSMGGPTFWNSFYLSQQMIGYCWATQKLLGTTVPGVLIDAIVGRKPTRTGVQFENEWQPFEYTQEKIQQWEQDVTNHIYRILDYLFQGYFPTATAWCANKYGMCPYFDVCRMSSNTQGAILMSGQYAERTWSPLNH